MKRIKSVFDNWTLRFSSTLAWSSHGQQQLNQKILA